MSWYRAIQDVPLEENTFFLAHEFFDALPVHQFQVCPFTFLYKVHFSQLPNLLLFFNEKLRKKSTLQHLALGRLGARAAEVLLSGAFSQGQPFGFVLSILFFVGFVDRIEHS